MQIPVDKAHNIVDLSALWGGGAKQIRDALRQNSRAKISTGGDFRQKRKPRCAPTEKMNQRNGQQCDVNYGVRLKNATAKFAIN